MGTLIWRIMRIKTDFFGGLAATLFDFSRIYSRLRRGRDPHPHQGLKKLNIVLP
jgi:hypothetical protein